MSYTYVLANNETKVSYLETFNGTHVRRKRGGRLTHGPSRHNGGWVVMGQLLLLSHVRPAAVTTAASAKINKTQTWTKRGQKNKSIYQGEHAKNVKRLVTNGFVYQGISDIHQHEEC